MPPAIPTLSVEKLQTHFFTAAGVAKAVDDVSFDVYPGEIVGLVGESGSGKSITGFSILGLIDAPGRIVGGRVLFKGVDLTSYGLRSVAANSGNRIAMIFQDPMMTLRSRSSHHDAQMMETVRAHAPVSKQAAREQAREALAAVGIPAPDERLKAYPHQLSGGMRQRVAIAIAMLHKPDLIIADEPTTALDVTIQAQILAQMQKLCARSNTAMVWVSHDLAVVAGLADRICVMYAGRMKFEAGDVDTILERPRHPYTIGLLGAVPENVAHGEPLMQVPGVAPSALALPVGCAFSPRCTRLPPIHAGHKSRRYSKRATAISTDVFIPLSELQHEHASSYQGRPGVAPFRETFELCRAHCADAGRQTRVAHGPCSGHREP